MKRRQNAGSFVYTFCVLLTLEVALGQGEPETCHTTRRFGSGVFNRDPYIEPLVSEDEEDDEEQFRAYGTTAKGRYITVPFTIRKDRIRAITAWPMTLQEFEDYAAKIH